MPVLYVNFKKQESLTKPPYNSFIKKYDIIKNDVNGKQIDLSIGSKESGFSNGLYIDNIYCKNPKLQINFATIPCPDNTEKSGTLVHVSYSYEGEENGECLELYRIRVKAIKERVPYYFLPSVTHFEFSSQFDDKYRLLFDVLVDEEEKVPEVCCSLISLIIAIFTLDS